MLKHALSLQPDSHIPSRQKGASLLWQSWEYWGSVGNIFGEPCKAHHKYCQHFRWSDFSQKWILQRVWDLAVYNSVGFAELAVLSGSKETWFWNSLICTQCLTLVEADSVDTSLYHGFLPWVSSTHITHITNFACLLLLDKETLVLWGPALLCEVWFWMFRQSAC